MNFTYRMTVNTTSTKGALGCKTIQLGMLESHVQCSPGCILFVSTWIFSSLVNAPRFSHSISKRLVLTPQMDSGGCAALTADPALHVNPKALNSQATRSTKP